MSLISCFLCVPWSNCFQPISGSRFSGRPRVKLWSLIGFRISRTRAISSKSTGYNWSLNDYTPAPGIGAASPADNGYQGGFASALMLKDLRLAMEAAKASGAKVPMGEHATAIYEAFNEAGGGGKDFGAIFATL